MSDEPPRPVLDYSHHGGDPHWVSLHRFFSDYEAQFVANELAAAGIRYQLYNNSMAALKPYGGVVKVDLEVLSDDLDRAKAVLVAHLNPEAVNQLEPDEADDASQPKQGTDEAGQPIELLAAAAFDNAGDLRQAGLVLESARIEAYLPRLVPRGDAPPGEGNRFVLRVRAEDLPRAFSVLRNDGAEDGEENDEPRCPKCGSWNVHEIKHEFTNLLLGIVGRSKPEECECLKCHHVGKRDEFLASRS